MLFWLLAAATPAVAIASFWPTDAALQSGWGQRFCSTVLAIGMIFIAAEAQEVWRAIAATEHEPAHPDFFLYATTTSLWVASYVTLLMFASTGRMTWGLIRLHYAFEPSIISITILHQTTSQLLLRGVAEPARCVAYACRTSNTVAEVWAKQCCYTVGLWSISGLFSTANRQCLARRMGLTHVSVNLCDVRGDDLNRPWRP